MEAKKKRPTREQMEKIRFQEQMKSEIEKKFQGVAKSWKEHVDRFAATKADIDSRYDNLLLQLDTIRSQVGAKLTVIKKENAALKKRIDQQRLMKERLQNKAETNHIEVSAEIDLELKLQQRAAELQVQRGESRRRLEQQLEKKIRLKKAYLRNINQYKKLKAAEEERQNKRRALRKKAMLEQKKKEMEEEAIRAKAKEDDPMNRYRALLAAAGHISVNDQGSKPETPTTFFQGPLIEPSAPRPDQIVIDNPQYDEGIWLENNIRTLLSTGNYTDDDPVIRGLRAQLCKLRCE